MRRQPVPDGSYHVQSAPHRPLRAAGGQPPGGSSAPGCAARRRRSRSPGPTLSSPSSRRTGDRSSGTSPWRWSPMTAPWPPPASWSTMIASRSSPSRRRRSTSTARRPLAAGPRGLALAARSADPCSLEVLPLARRHTRRGRARRPPPALARRRRTGRHTGGAEVRRILPFERRPARYRGPPGTCLRTKTDAGRRAWWDDPPPDDARPRRQATHRPMFRGGSDDSDAEPEGHPADITLTSPWVTNWDPSASRPWSTPSGCALGAVVDFLGDELDRAELVELAAIRATS